MKLTRASVYALQAMEYLAATKADGPVTSQAIAADRKIPERFLLKVLRPLVSGRVLLSVKGPHGGYRLARTASRISLLEIIEAVEGPVRGVAPLALEGGRKGNTFDQHLEAVCEQAATLTRKRLGKVSIADLVGE
jgi:Rrf2 family protein